MTRLSPETVSERNRIREESESAQRFLRGLFPAEEADYDHRQRVYWVKTYTGKSTVGYPMRTFRIFLPRVNSDDHTPDIYDITAQLAAAFGWRWDSKHSGIALQESDAQQVIRHLHGFLYHGSECVFDLGGYFRRHDAPMYGCNGGIVGYGYPW